MLMMEDGDHINDDNNEVEMNYYDYYDILKMMITMIFFDDVLIDVVDDDDDVDAMYDVLDNGIHFSSTTFE